MDSAKTITVRIFIGKEFGLPEDIDRRSRLLLEELRQVQGVERASLTQDLNPPPYAKGVGGFLIGILTAEVSSENLSRVFYFLSSRFLNKTIELEVIAKDRKLKVRVGSEEELEAVIKAAKDFLALQ